MSQQCPLCGNYKLEEALFCEDCAKKIRSDYEIDLPESPMKESLRDVAKKPLQPESLLTEEIPDPDTKTELRPESDDVKMDDSPSVLVKEQNEDRKKEKSGRKKKGKTFLWTLLTLVLLVIAFFVYKETIRKSNLERSGWDRAMKVHSVDGYLTYMTSHPEGQHFDEAQSKLMTLKQAEAAGWEMLQTTDQISALRDFLQQNPESSYTSLVRMRLDSLTWMGALKANSVTSYSDYMLQAQSGAFKGEYLTMAEARYDMLFQSYPVDEATLDSIRQTVNGFYLSLSDVEHTGMSRYLAPVVTRFFDSGGASRERVTGELLMAAAMTQEETLQFAPDLNGVQYEITLNEPYVVNVPLVKSYVKEGAREQVSGYIVHLKLNALFQIVSIYETKPFSGAP